MCFICMYVYVYVFVHIYLYTFLFLTHAHTYGCVYVMHIYCKPVNYRHKQISSNKQRINVSEICNPDSSLTFEKWTGKSNGPSAAEV